MSEFLVLKAKYFIIACCLAVAVPIGAVVDESAEVVMQHMTPSERVFWISVRTLILEDKLWGQINSGHLPMTVETVYRLLKRQAYRKKKRTQYSGPGGIAKAWSKRSKPSSGVNK